MPRKANSTPSDEGIKRDTRTLLAVGSHVHYVMGRSGKCRPAVVVEVWSPDTINLQVFTDQRNDGQLENVIWKTSITYSNDNEGNTWHWPEIV